MSSRKTLIDWPAFILPRPLEIAPCCCYNYGGSTNAKGQAMTQTQEAKHTPGTLRVQYDPGNPNPRLVANDGLVAVLSVGSMFVEPQDANAERLAACWNCHDELVAAMRWAIIHVGALADGGGMVPHVQQHNDPAGCCLAMHAAIAKATPTEAAQ